MNKQAYAQQQAMKNKHEMDTLLEKLYPCTMNRAKEKLIWSFIQDIQDNSQACLNTLTPNLFWSIWKSSCDPVDTKVKQRMKKKTDFWWNRQVPNDSQSLRKGHRKVCSNITTNRFIWS